MWAAGGGPLVETRDMAHGRRYWINDISGPEWNGYANLYGRQQAIRVERQLHQPS